MEKMIGRPLIEKRKKETHISIRKDNILKDIEGGEKKKEKKINEILFLCLICLLVIIWLIYICSKKDIFLSYLENEKEYGIIIDAGSNGTRIHLFEWKRKEYKVINKNEENNLTKVKEIFNANIKKSISTISYNEIKDILIYLINKVIDHLIEKKIYIYNKKKWKSYPFYFEATGGMRNLKQEERNLRMKYIKNILSNDNYNPFNFLNEYARILSGEEEGIYGWLAVNNLLNSIFSKPNNTYGAIDLGGSSTQITFYPIDDNILENYNSLLLNNKLIRLYSHSFIGYGWIDSLFRVNIYLCLGIIKKLSARNIKKISQHEDYYNNYINDYFYKNLPNYNSFFFSSNIKINNNIKENNNHHNNDHINDNVKKQNYTYNYYKQKYIYTNPKKVYYIKDNINNSNKSYQNIWDILLQEIIKYIHYSQKNYPIGGYSTDTYDYTYNIYDDQPYDIENFIKTIKDFKRNSKEDTIMVVQNPCLPYPYEMKIILPTYNLITSQFVITKNVNGNKIGKIYDIKNNDNNYNHKDNINDMYELNSNEGYDNFISNGFLRLNIINNNMSLMDNIYEDFKNKGYLNNVLKKINDNKMNDNLKNDMIKYLFEKIINEKIKELYINISVKIMGSNNFKQCLECTKKLFYEQPCFLSSCSFNGIYQPNLENNQFVLHGQFKKVITYLGFKKYLQLNKMKKHIHKICNMNLYELTKNNMSNKILDNQITTFCWKSIWSYSLLFYGFKFNENSKLLIINDDINISYDSPGTSHTWKQYCNRVENKEQNNYLHDKVYYNNEYNLNNKIDNISWTHGSMIYQINTFQEHVISRKFKLYNDVLFALFLIIFIILIILGGYIFKFKEILKNKYRFL
ncbi:apyrase, putative [Plasmodium gaboni]|uniref:Apyrase, putative n=1 Tax=Plasmodium gaboni TaxID=647221 RepID=A0ABY1UX92_9APIC|nr:apyrase, putative [Plasmodium gaboni]